MNAILALPASVPPVNGQRQPLPTPPVAQTASGPTQRSLLPQTIFFRGIPSPRDREIFRQVVICRRTKTDVARQYQLSQPRISQTCGEVQRWMKEHTPRQTEETTQPQWLNLAENLCRERLEAQYAMAMEALEASRQPRQWKGWDVEGNPVEKRPEEYKPPQSALLNIARKATIELARLDGIWGSGDAWAGRNRQKLNDFQQQRDAQWDAQLAADEAMLADLEARGGGMPPAAEDEAALPAAHDRPADGTYERLWNLPADAAPRAEVTNGARDASNDANEVSSEGRERKLDMDLLADRLKKAYAPPEDLAARLTPPMPPAPRGINGHARGIP
jgi:hypothetical protein